MTNLWKSLLAGPAVLGAMLAMSTTAVAGETPANLEIKQAENTTQNKTRAQVTSVSQLSDVQPTDWAFQALQSLVERYGCIAGYPNGTYRGNRAMTRYEFAAGLNACLNRVNELIATATADLVNKQDLATLQRLQEEFAAELATLRGRVDTLEAKAAELEANQFSTTTKLNAEAVVTVAGIATGENARGEKISRNTIVGDRIRLNFDTTFNGEDLLRTRLQASNLNAFSSTSTFTPEGDFRFAGGAFDDSNSNDVGLDALLYQFKIGEKTTVVVEANAGAIDDFTNTVNPFLDGDGGTGALSHFGTRNPIYYQLNGTGLGLRHEFSKNLELSLGYLANAAANPDRGSGLFNGPYGAMAQLTIKPSDKFTFGLTYVNAYNNDFTANGSTGSNRANLRSALANNPNLPDRLATFSELDVPISSNSYGIEASFQLSPKFVLGGWAGYTNTRTLSSVGGTIPRGELEIWNYAVTLAFPDLGKKGNVAGIIVGMEPKVTGVSDSLRRAIGKDEDTSYHIEAFYQYQVSENISITPGVIWLTAPDHNSNNDGVVIGAVRTTFSF
ncbi:MAG: iron uptake porin [Brasilonema angustatum HA4187-MV1]|jgi:hypothetical protein|nr:iron uptake porin [Brasilonema angustatum HA4187-MV1]